MHRDPRFPFVVACSQRSLAGLKALRLREVLRRVGEQIQVTRWAAAYPGRTIVSPVAQQSDVMARCRVGPMISRVLSHP
jgi:hypothetical protein